MPDTDPSKAQALGFADNYDSEKYFVSVFGDPRGEDWGWLVTGHHFAVNFTVSGGKIAFTPMFLGANPQVVQEGRYAGWQLLQHESDRALALLGSLDDDQLAEAVVAAEVDGAVFAGPGKQESHQQSFGIRASDLNPVQRQLLDGLLDEYLGDASNEAAARQRASIEADGSHTLIDYVREPSGDGAHNHVHSIMRDPSNDYGSDWLRRHYHEAHQE